MAPQPSSPSSGRMSDGRDNPTLAEYDCFVRCLCSITGISTDGQDIHSNNFKERLLEYIEQELALVNGIYTSVAKRRSFNYETPPPPPPACHSNGHEKASELSQILPNEVNEVVVDDPKLPCTSPEIITITSTPHHVTFPDYAPNSPSENIITSTDTRQNGNGDNHENSATSTALSGGAHESVIPSGQPPSANQAEVETGEADNFVEKIIQVEPLPPSRQDGLRKKKSRQFQNSSQNESGTRHVGNHIIEKTIQVSLKNKGHAPDHCDALYLYCTCGKPYESKSSLNQHIQRFTSEWKFKCEYEQCTERFYHFCKLKYHLKKQHGMENPLEKYATGCSFCGLWIRTRAELSEHQKTEHNIHETRKRVNFRRTSGMTPRRSGMTPRWSGMTPRRSGMTPRWSGMTPRWSGMTPRRSGMTPRRSGMTPRWSGMTPRWSGMTPCWSGTTPPQSGMTPRPSGMSPRLSEVTLLNGQPKLRCKCNKKFRTFELLELHSLRYKVNDNAIECSSCQKKFIYKCEFKQHRKRKCCQINANSSQSEYNGAGAAPQVSIDFPMAPPNSNVMPSYDLEIEQRQQNDTWDMKHQSDAKESSHEATPLYCPVRDDDGEEIYASGDIPLPCIAMSLPPPSQLEDQHHTNENCYAESSARLNKQNGRNKYDNSYRCVLCPQAFRKLKQLRRHQEIEGHQSDQKGHTVKCGLCLADFRSSKTFHSHRDQDHRHEREGHHKLNKTSSENGLPNSVKMEESVFINWNFCPKDYRFKYLCLTCPSDTFSDAKQLREHWCSIHQSALTRKVTCFKCKLVSPSCESFIQHMCSKKTW